MYKAEVIERPSRKIVQFILLALRTVYKYINISKRNSIENLGFFYKKKDTIANSSRPCMTFEFVRSSFAEDNR